MDKRVGILPVDGSIDQVDNEGGLMRGKHWEEASM